MKSNALTAAAALLALAIAAPAFASGDVAADRYWKQHQTASRMLDRSSTQQSNVASSTADGDAKKPVVAACCLTHGVAGPVGDTHHAAR